MGVKCRKEDNKIWQKEPRLNTHLIEMGLKVKMADGGINHSIALVQTGDMYVWGITEYNGREFDN